ncbi:MAG: hypothetical protein IKZ34_01080 [Alphaproteobacteria bacterium]|nr:hypothetical protein [Alphaproteobacteria bacterium]
MAQTCVFCGKEPKNKNKEHVIPQWLTKYLERNKTICDLAGIADMQIPFCALTFPACEKCNTEDSVLEVNAKKVVEKLMNGESATGAEISVLLDWFDKLRTGVWLGGLMLSKRLEEISPYFHINKRIGLKDRMLIIERVEDVGKGLGLVGVNNQMFVYAPNVFQVWFHDVLITSASSTGLVSNKLGFPQVGKIEGLGTSTFSFEFTKGREKTTHPVVMNVEAKDKIVIYQPIFKEYTSSECFDTDYVRNHSYDWANGLGGIFVQKYNNTIRYMKPEDKINLLPKKQPKSAALNSIERVFRLQNHLITNVYKEDIMKTKLKACVQQNLSWINALRKQK